MIIKFLLLIYIFTTLLFNSQFKFQADGELLEYKENNITINKLTDNVQVFNDSLYLETDQAYNYKEINKLHLYGNTKMISNIDTLICDSMIYWLDKDSLFAFGNVKLTQNNRKLNSDKLNFWKTNGYRGSSFIADGNVNVFDNDKMIEANIISYSDSTQIMGLKSGAKVTSNNRKLFGENIQINFIDSLISFINVSGYATAHNIIKAKIQKDSDFYKDLVDIMKGNSIDVSFKNDQIQTIVLDRMASAMYHALDSSLLMGINTVDGDLINLDFQDDQLNKINVTGDARGEFNPEPNNSNIDSIITYASDEIDYFLNSQESYIGKNGNIKYQNMILEANYIHVDWMNNILDAVKKSDKYPTVITSGGEPMQGDSLRYNLLDKQGTIYKGQTKVDNAYYHGDKIYRDDPNLVHVVSSQYTSCDLEHPHYSFYSDNMKMIPGDRIIARPLILKILDFPIVGIPFAILPNKGGGRHSGWLMPSFGFDNTNGTLMNGLGYYWAPNDYMDSKFVINFADRIGFWLHNKINYKLRYILSGHLDIKFARKLSPVTKYIESITTDSTTQEYQINFSHKHEISPSQKLNITLKYVSNYDFYENTSSDPLANIDAQSSRSSLLYSKSWPEAGNSFNFSLSDITDLKKQKIIDTPATDSTSVIFPIVRANYPGATFYHGTSSVFGEGDKWYNQLKWSFASRYSGYYKSGAYSKSFYSSIDTATYSWSDTTAYKNGLNTQIEFAYPQKIFSWLNLTSRLKLTEDWIFKYADYPDKTFTSYIIKDGFKRRLTGSLSMGLNTKIYGVFPFNVGEFEALRHTITPSASISYIPNITAPISGYDLNKIFTNSGEFTYDVEDGRLLDPFYGSVANATSEREKLIYSFRIQNVFQTKYKINSSNSESSLENNYTFAKATVLDWDIRTQYDAFADSVNWSPFTSSIQSQIPLIGSSLNIDLTHDIYKINNSGQRVDEFHKVFFDILPVPQLTKINFRTSFSISGNRLLELGDYSSVTQDINSFTIDDKSLWAINFGLTYKKEKKSIPSGSGDTTFDWIEQFQLNTATTLNFSAKWKLRYRVNFDLIEQTMGWPSFTFTRNLHCWEFNFNWIPNKSYFLHIYVKKPELRDIKLESRSTNNRF